jgi:hypothetical protein
MLPARLPGVESPELADLNEVNTDPSFLPEKLSSQDRKASLMDREIE